MAEKCEDCFVVKDVVANIRKNGAKVYTITLTDHQKDISFPMLEGDFDDLAYKVVKT